MHLLGASHSKSCIENASNLGLHLVGVDGFWLFANNSVQPDQSISTDLGNFESFDSFYGYTQRILNENIDRDDVAFEIVFEEGVL